MGGKMLGGFFGFGFYLLVIIQVQPSTGSQGNAQLCRLRQRSHTHCQRFHLTEHDKCCHLCPHCRCCQHAVQDHIYCVVLAQSAVDAAFSGFSGCLVGQVNTHCG
mmetsp:Transcript_4721/g.14294  ORF Transcript_4721/g.14294 Transcript_4721/m.14294 type:complete len:105 (-) Transcript_4721:1089-1403(-)